MCGSNCKGCLVKQGRTARKRVKRLKSVAMWVGLVVLLGAYVYGKLIHSVDYQSIFNQYFPTSLVDPQGHDLFAVYRSDTLWAHIKTSENQGYGGPLEIGVVIGHDSTIAEVIVLEEKETRSFFNKLVNRDFFKQFKGRSIYSALQLAEDIDGVSGATVSSKAFAHAIETAAHQYAKSEHGIADLSPAPEFKIGFGEMAVLALLVWSIALYWHKNKILMYVMHIVASVLIGFYLNLSLSITNFGSLLQGYFPNVHDYLVWYILVFGVLMVALIFGKNIYCYRICPFYTIQWLANRISGINLSLQTTMGELAKYVAGVLLWLSLLVGFLTATPSAGSYEPFATFFSFEGEGIQWFILQAVFFSAFFIKEVFCRYYCPVGGFLKFVIIRVRKPIFKQIKSWQNAKAKPTT